MAGPTIKDVAQRAGVSLGTVSNVLNNPQLVAPTTLRRVERAIADVGFVRNRAASQLRGARSPAIGLVVLDIDNPFFTEVARGVEDAASEADHLLILCNSASSPAREERQLRLLEEQRVAGILMTPVSTSVSRRFQEIRRRGTPIVLLDRASTKRDQCSVAVDDVHGGRLAASHLAELGHTQVALINGPLTIQQCVDRREGFLDGLHEAGITLRKTYDVEMPEMTIAAGRDAAARLLKRAKAPTAVFCANDLLAIGAQHTALATARRVPEDLGIIGYDDVAYAAMSFVPLTSVRQPAYDLGYRAAMLLLEEAQNEDHQHEHVVFEPELIVRASTAPLNGNGSGRVRLSAAADGA